MPSSTDPRTPQEIERWAHLRRPHERETVPVPGERLLFRESDFGEAVPAVVDAVQDMSAMTDHWTGRPGPPDPNIWRPELDSQYQPTGRWLMKDDPWPWVAIRVIRAADDGSEDLAPPRWCKEARVRGSVGWLRPGTRAHHGNYSEGE